MVILPAIGQSQIVESRHGKGHISVDVRYSSGELLALLNHHIYMVGAVGLVESGVSRDDVHLHVGLQRGVDSAHYSGYYDAKIVQLF